MGTAAIHTVLGPIPPETLGPTLMHEHIFCDFYRVTGNLDHLLNDEDLAVEELARLTAAGGRGLVECTTLDLGRDEAGLRRIARRTGLQIVMGTGWYRQPYYPPEIDRATVEVLAERMIADLRGESSGAVPAGILGEIGADRDYLTAQEERVLRAAARAQRATGAPITTHASMYPVGVRQLALLCEEGVDPERVVVGHCDTYLDPTYHRRVLEAGAYVQFDTIGRRHINPDERRADALTALIREGWVERLLLSSDRCYRSDLHAFGGPGYDVVFDRFFTLLRARGIGEDELTVMTVENPRRVLAW
ncbi:MAG: phosphotriesterase-related protein [Armatimonadota bacterium]|nr:phosphotriesterase-related protein [Armatimonadota bacterium]